MFDHQKITGKFIVFGLLPMVMAACGGDPVISFSQQVKPIIDQHCLECHEPNGQGAVISGFDLSTYEGLMKGTDGGPMVIAGDIEGSNILVLMEGRADPSISMPHGQNEPVPKQDIQTIRSWIGQGANNN